MALTAEEIQTIVVDSTLRRAPSITTPEALDARERVDAQVDAIEARGNAVEMTFEWPGLDDEPERTAPPAPPARQPRIPTEPRTPRRSR